MRVCSKCKKPIERGEERYYFKKKYYCEYCFKKALNKAINEKPKE